MQIRTKLTLLFLLLTAAILAGVLIEVYFTYRINTEEAFYDGLRLKAEMTVQASLERSDQWTVLPNNWPAPDNDSLPYRDNVSLYNDTYERVFTIRKESVPISSKVLHDIYVSGEERFHHFNLQGYGKVVDGPQNRPFVVVAEGYCDPSELEKLRWFMLAGFFTGLFLIAVAGWYFAGQALAPVSQMMNAVDEMHPSDLTKRIYAKSNTDEISRLAATFNRLLDRVEHAFRMQRMFLSNVSHELKNPLTAIRTQLDVILQRDREADVYKNALKSVLDDVRSISAVEEKLLQLARIYNDPNAINLEPIRLDEVLWSAKAQLQKRHPEYKIGIEMGEMPDAEEDLYVNANEPLLKTAIVNLLENGCKYSNDHKAIIQVVFRPDFQHEVRIKDNGPGIPPEEQKLIFEPFFRSPRHIKIKGTGVGLSLVQSILGLHHIRLELTSPPEGGSIFALHFPPKKS